MEAVTRRAKRGFNLIEAAIVLAVVGGVIGAIWVGAATMIENYKVNKTVEGVFLAASNIQNLISLRDAKQQWGGAGSSIDNDIRNIGVFPADWLHGSKIISPFGAVYVYDFSEYPGVPADETFLISLLSIPKSVCIKLIVEISNKNRDNNKNVLRLIQLRCLVPRSCGVG